jgi:hypothetical protein
MPDEMNKALKKWKRPTSAFVVRPAGKFASARETQQAVLKEEGIGEIRGTGNRCSEQWMHELLKEFRIVEGASLIAAPLCRLTFVQLGAGVIRFDPIGGGPDFYRWPLAPLLDDDVCLLQPASADVVGEHAE